MHLTLSIHSTNVLFINPRTCDRSLKFTALHNRLWHRMDHTERSSVWFRMHFRIRFARFYIFLFAWQYWRTKEYSGLDASFNFFLEAMHFPFNTSRIKGQWNVCFVRSWCSTNLIIKLKLFDLYFNHSNR